MNNNRCDNCPYINQCKTTGNCVYDTFYEEDTRTEDEIYYDDCNERYSSDD